MTNHHHSSRTTDRRITVRKGEGSGEQEKKEIGNEREASNESLFRILREAPTPLPLPPHINDTTANKE